MPDAAPVWLLISRHSGKPFHRASRTVDGRLVAAGLLAHGSSVSLRPSQCSNAERQWHLRRKLAAYSCGRSRGFEMGRTLNSHRVPFSSAARLRAQTEPSRSYERRREGRLSINLNTRQPAVPQGDTIVQHAVHATLPPTFASARRRMCSRHERSRGPRPRAVGGDEPGTAGRAQQSRCRRDKCVSERRDGAYKRPRCQFLDECRMSSMLARQQNSSKAQSDRRHLDDRSVPGAVAGAFGNSAGTAGLAHQTARLIGGARESSGAAGRVTAKRSSQGRQRPPRAFRGRPRHHGTRRIGLPLCRDCADAAELH